jgi:PAS domain S-box-containing protein
MDGLEFLDAVREECPDVPFVPFTAKGSEEVASEAISRGVTDHLRKRSAPDQYEVLVNRVRNAVDRHRAERRFDAFVESAADGVAIVDEDGTILRVNERLEEQFGYDREELVDEPVELLVPERQREEHARQWAEYATSPEPRPMGAALGLVGRRTDGSEVPVDVSLTPIDPNGREVLAAVRVRTERPGSDEGQAGMRGTETLPVGILVRDASGMIVHATERAADLLGVARASRSRPGAGRSMRTTEGSLRDVDGLGARDLPQTVGRDGEHGLGRPGGRPDGVVVDQRVVDVDRNLGVVAERRDAADAPAERLPDVVGIGHPDLVPGDAPEGGELRLADAVRAAGHDDHQPVGVEDDAARDLGDVTAHSLRRVGCSLRPLRELVDLHLEAVLLACPFGELLGARVHASGIAAARQRATDSARRVKRLLDLPEETSPPDTSARP